MKRLRITVEGKAYDVTVEVLDEKKSGGPAPVAAASLSSSQATPAPSPAPPAAGSEAGPGMVPSPLAAKVVSLSVKVGDRVEQGQQLVVLEAMKMNTFVMAPAAGRIAQILVKADDAVEEGQPLIKLE